MADENHQSSIKLSELAELITTKIDDFAKKSGFEIDRPKTNFDFNAAIKAHIDWKMKLGNYLNNPDGSLDSKKVCLDNACVLGKWLYGDGSLFKNTNHRLYEEVRLSHAEFHKIAGRVIDHIHKGQKDLAGKILTPNGEYSRVSENTVILIEKLKFEVEPEQKVRSAG